MLLLIYLNERICFWNYEWSIDLLGGNVTFRVGRFNGDVGDDEIVGTIVVDGCCIGRTTATGRDDWD